MQVLVTGGNGFVGHHLIAALVRRGDDVRVLALPEEDVSAVEPLGVTVHRGDVRFEETLQPAMEGVDAVVHLAAMMHVWRPLQDYREVNVNGTLNVCRAAMQSHVGRVVHMSSSSVYGTAVSGLVDESYPLDPFDDPYAVTKAEADLAVQRMIADEGLNAVIIRPDQIFGPGDRLHFGETVEQLRAGRGIVVGRGDNCLPLVFVEDVVAALLLALDASEAGGVFNITNDEPLTQLEFLRAVAEATGARPRVLRLPRRALYAVAFCAERLAPILGVSRRPPITRLGVAFRGADLRFSIERARRNLGYVPKVPLRDGIRRTAAWYLSEVDRDTDTEAIAGRSMQPVAEASGR